MNENEKRVYDLVTLLKGYREEYYNQSEPSITDDEYDALFDELAELECKTGLYLSDSPTQCVGFEVMEDSEKVRHRFPVLSMLKTKSEDSVIDFVNNKEVLFFHKVDGITIVLEYEEGCLVSASTRGNGMEGKSVISSIKGFSGIPHTISCKKKLTVIGEGFIHVNDYEKYKDSFLDTNGKIFIDARNFASSAILSNVASICQKYSIGFLAFTSFMESDETETKQEQLMKMADLGFSICEYKLMRVGFSKETVVKIMNDLKEDAYIKNIPIDGIVVTFNNVEFSKEQGRTSHHYNDSLAYKF